MTVVHAGSIRTRTMLWSLLAALFLIAVPMLWSASPLVLLGVCAIGALVAVAGAWGLRRLRHRAPIREGLARVALAGGLLAAVLVALPLYWLVLQPALKPLAVPRVTMGNGERQLVFQGMVHIGSAQFYRSVAYDLLRARETGSVLYFEGVGNGTAEASAWFNTVMGTGGDINAQYARLAGLCGLHFQNDFIGFLLEDEATHPGRTVTADVSETDIYEEWQRLVAQHPEMARQLERDHPRGDGGPSGIARVVDLVSHVGDRSHAFVGAVCRGVFTRALGGKESADVLNTVVLDLRNRRLAERVLADPAANLYLVYGYGHFPGFVRELRQRDPAWKIEGVAWSTAIESPEDVIGRLDVDADAMASGAH